MSLKPIIWTIYLISGDFGCAPHQYFSYYSPPHTLKYPIHAPAEKSQFFSKYDHGSKVFDYDHVALYRITIVFDTSEIMNGDDDIQFSHGRQPR